MIRGCMCNECVLIVCVCGIFSFKCGLCLHSYWVIYGMCDWIIIQLSVHSDVGCLG